MATTANAPIVPLTSARMLGFAVFAGGEVTFIEGNTETHRGLAEALAETEGGQVVPAY